MADGNVSRFADYAGGATHGIRRSGEDVRLDGQTRDMELLE